MNLKKLKRLIELYKRDFNKIHDKEIYKWEAVKMFQDNWDLEAPDITTMIANSFSKTGNLMDSGQYFPRRMLTAYAKQRPNDLKPIFENLYNEDIDLTGRIETFQNEIRSLHDKILDKDKSTYQDQRAVMVYLCLRYPDRYFLYKFEMFKEFIDKIDYDYEPKGGKSENIIQYLNLCNLIREEIIKDNELIKLHQGRLRENHFYDSSLNILTQDIIYAAVKHLSFTIDGDNDAQINIELISDSFTSDPLEAILTGRFVNFIDNERENKRIGDLGELVILEYERDFLVKNNIVDFKPIHKSKNEGDGLGYDILSQTLDGKPKYIEVKTTKSSLHNPFYVTKNELVRSIKEADSFYLYRLFEFDEKTKKGKLLIIKGDISGLCINPTTYKVRLTKAGTQQKL